MNKTKFTFLPSKKRMRNLSDLTKLLLVVRQYKDEYGMPEWIDYDKFVENIKILKKDSSEFVEDFVSQLRPYFGKYLLMTFSYNANYDEPQEDNWVVERQIAIMPYQYLPSNQNLFGLIAELGQPYHSGIEDKSIDLYETVNNKKVEFEVITEEQFWQYVNTSVHDVFNLRMDKMNSENYEFGENGWKHK